MTTKSREYLYGNSIRMSAERARDARKEADRIACEAWNKRMLGYKGPAQPSPMLGDALNAGYCYLEVRCLGCDTHQTVALDVIRRPKTTPIHELERYMRCKTYSELQARPYKRSHLVALRPSKISAVNPASTWWPGETMISRLNLYARIAISAALIVTAMGRSSAQKIQVPLIDVDCSAYYRQDDGTWVVLYSNKVMLGSNVNKAVMPGDDPRNLQLTPVSTLDSVLNTICAKFKK